MLELPPRHWHRDVWHERPLCPRDVVARAVLPSVSSGKWARAGGSALRQTRGMCAQQHPLSALGGAGSRHAQAATLRGWGGRQRLGVSVCTHALPNAQASVSVPVCVCACAFV